MERSAGAMEPVAVISGKRTPFGKAFGALAKVPADELGRIALEGVLADAGVKPADVGEVIFGNVASPADASNVARVIALRAGVPNDRISHTVNRNCASGVESVVQAWHVLQDRRTDLIVAGGTESMSNVPLLWDPRVMELLLQWKRASAVEKVKLLGKLRPALLKPVAALELGLTDPTCGLNMGQTGEVLAKEFGVSREEQDQFALRSHQRAAAAWERCFFKGEVVPVSADKDGGKPVDKDTGPRANQTMEALRKLRPIFEKNGTITPGNSCPITDGAAAVVMTRTELAKDIDHEPLGYLRGYALAGCDPRRMGLGPVFAISKLLNKTGMALKEFDLVEINEAFAAQVLSCVKAMASNEFAQSELGRQRAIGVLDPERLNVNGGAIALGHPVGTSGTRLILTLLRALRDRGLKRGLATLCVGGGQGAAVWVETNLKD